MKKHIADSSRNVTRFLVVGQSDCGATGKDKTSILLSLKDRPGALFRALKPFHDQKMNLTKIESRPMKRRAWEYLFFIDCDGHAADLFAVAKA